MRWLLGLILSQMVEGCRIGWLEVGEVGFWVGFEKNLIFDLYYY